MSEFDLISKYFAQLTYNRSEAAGLQNDAAVLDIPQGKQLVVTSDTLIADVHFFADQSPETIAKKALRSNLSDLNAMGAVPYCYQLCLSMPKQQNRHSERSEESGRMSDSSSHAHQDDKWLERFSNSLFEDQEQYGIFLSGGDTTCTNGPLSISITAFGLVESGKSVARSGAQDGDLIVLSNSVGDAYCGLQSLRGDMKDVPQDCIDLYYVPTPPMMIAPMLAEYATAALDISDGLLQDLGHIAKASDLRAEIDLSSIAFSEATQNLIDRNIVTPQELLSGGDDYQLLMTVPPEKFDQFLEKAASKGISLQAIGVFKSGSPTVILRDNSGSEIPIVKSGWSHF